MSDAKSSEFNVMALLQSLPGSLIFIFLVDWQMFPDIISLYNKQSELKDDLKVYTLIGIGVFVAVNLIIISFFAYSRYFQDMQVKADYKGKRKVQNAKSK